jgi:hypothetical protein
LLLKVWRGAAILLGGILRRHRLLWLHGLHGFHLCLLAIDIGCRYGINRRLLGGCRCRRAMTVEIDTEHH